MKNILFFLVLFLSSSVLSQKNFIQGELVDGLNGDALAYANVGLLTSFDSVFTKGTTTDMEGKFEFKNVDTGNYFLRVSYVGYPTSLIKIKVDSGLTKLGILKISKTSQSLDEVSIVSEKLMYQYEADKKVYNVSEDPSVQLGSASDALQNAPGVWVDLEGNITLRGVDNVEIWINDKPSRIPADGLKTYLMQLPANSLERIEVMTNPSSKFSASGSAGIINIVTKQKIKKNFLLSTGATVSTKPQYNPWLSFVWSNEKIKINTYISRWWQQNENNNYNNGWVRNDTANLYSYRNSGYSESRFGWNSAYIDVEYQFTDKTKANAYFGGSSSINTSQNSNINEKNELLLNGLSNIVRQNSQSGNGINWHSGGSIQHDVIAEKHYFNLDFALGSWMNDYTSENNEEITGFLERNRNFKSQEKYGGRWYDVDVKYFNNFKKDFTIETGASYNHSPFSHVNPVDTFSFSDNVWNHTPFYSNEKDAYSNEANAFVSWQQKIKSFTYKVGLRSEYRHNFLKSLPLNKEITADYFGLFPSAHLSYQTSKNYSYTLSYSRRVQYPHIWYLDPFISYINEESIWIGNALLKPAYTNSFETGASKYFEKIGYLSVSLYHRRTDKSHTNTTEAVFDQHLQRFTMYSFMTNSGRDIFTGGDFIFSFRPKPFMNILINANVYNKDIYAEMESYTVSRNDFSFDAKLSFNTKIYKNFQFQLMGFYRSKAPTLAGSSDHLYFANASIRADFFQRKLSANITIQDFLNTQRNISFVNNPSIQSRSENWSNSRYLSFGITWRFGKIEMEKELKKGDMNQGGGTPGM